MKERSAGFWFGVAIGIATGFAARCAFPQTPAYASQMAMDLRAKLPADQQPFTRLLWCFGATNEKGELDQTKLRQQHAAAALGINFGPNISAVEWKLRYGGYPGQVPNVSPDGQFVVVDLRELANDEKQLARVVEAWDGMVLGDPYFSVNVAVGAKDKNGKQSFKRHHVLEAAPITLVYRLDWFLSRCLSTIDGGSYYQFRGLKVGETKLADYLAAKGVSTSGTTKDRAGLIRRVNNKPGSIELRYANSVRPTTALPLVALTKDIFDGAIEGAKDPFLSLLNPAYDGSEVFVTTENGYIEFSLWNAKGELVAEAPPNLVRDWTIPAPHTDRLVPAASCLRCHGAQQMWQPFRNEVKDTLTGFARYFGEYNSKKSGFENIRLLNIQYAGDQHEIDQRLQDARDSIDRRISASTGGMRAVPAVAAMVGLIDHYEYDAVDAAVACKEWGIVPQPDKDDPKTPPGVATLRKMLPAPSEEGTVAEGAAGLYARLLTVYPAVVEKDGKSQTELRGLSVTRRQFENFTFDGAARTAAFVAATKQAEKEPAK